jgi:hypothetical protein
MSPVAVCRAFVTVLTLLLWGCLYLNARCAYRLESGPKRTVSQLSLILGAVLIFVLQINLMERLAPDDAFGRPFFWFVLIECGGALAITFFTLLKERTRSRNVAKSTASLG